MKKIIYLVIVIVLLAVATFSLFNIIRWFIDTNNVKTIEKNLVENIKIEEIVDEVENINEPTDKTDVYYQYQNVALINVDINNLKKDNKDTVGWLQVSGTNINYPVTQSTDNDYYLNRDFLNRISASGWIFLDYRNNLEELRSNNIIYGHSRTGSTMFGTLKNVLKDSWLNNINNHIIKISTNNYNYLFQVFSVYSIEVESYYLKTTFNNDSETEKFFNTLKDRSIHNFNTSINASDKIITLSTCNGNERLVVHAKLIKQNNK